MAIKNLKFQFSESAVERKSDLIHGMKYKSQAFTDEQFYGCEFFGPFLECVHFTKCSFVGCRFTEISMAGCWLIDCQFVDCSFDQVKLNSSFVRQCVFESTMWNNVMLRGVTFIDTNLLNVRMIGCETDRTLIGGSTKVPESQLGNFVTIEEFFSEMRERAKVQKETKQPLEGQARELHIINRFESRMSSTAIRAARSAIGKEGTEQPFIRSYVARNPDCSEGLGENYASFLVLEAVNGQKTFKVETIQLTRAGERILEWREVERLATQFVLEAEQLRTQMYATASSLTSQANNSSAEAEK